MSAQRAGDVLGQDVLKSVDMFKETTGRTADRRGFIPFAIDEINGGAGIAVSQVGVNPSGRSRILHQSVQLPSDAAAFGCNLLARLLLKHHHKSNKFERCEEAVVILPVDQDVIIRRQKLLTNPWEGLLVQILTSSAGNSLVLILPASLEM